MEEAEQALWRAAGLSARPTADLAYPRVAAAFEFKRPLRFDDEFDIALRVAAIGRTSISYACTLWRDDDEIAAGTMTIVCVGGGANGGRPVAVPQSIREALTA
jgi:acyl-CoA thioesterase FadM